MTRGGGLASPGTPEPGHAGLSVLVVDNHRLFAEVLCGDLVERGGVGQASHASTLTEATTLAHTVRPDVVFADHDLGGEHGIHLIASLASLPAPPPLAILSASADPALIAEALERGARGWIVKNGALTDLLAAVETLVQGGTYVSNQVANDLIRLLVDRTAPRSAPTFVDGLSPRSHAVLSCLVAGMTRTDIASRLYMSPNTVRTHVQKLLRASGTHSTLALVSAARACGVAAIADEPAGSTVPTA